MTLPRDLLDDALRLVDAPAPLMVEATGPRRWWAGPLDVEGLALASVQAAATAAQVLAREPLGIGVDASRVAGAFGSFGHLRVDGRAPVAFAPLSGFFETADGWVRLHANYPHHAAALASALGSTDHDVVAETLLMMDALDAEARIRAAGGVAAAVRSPRSWRESPMGAAVDGQPWIRYDVAEEAVVARQVSPDSLRVVDFTRVIAGPTATQFLGLLGADVVRIDAPHLPELLDAHLDRDFNKRTSLADLARIDEKEDVEELLAQADVVVSGYRPGALSAFGLDWESLHARHPHLLMVELDAWGDSGPWANVRGFDSIVQAAVGIAEIYATGEGARPGALPVQALDYATGYAAAAACYQLAARRNRDGVAGRAHLSLARTAHALLDMTPRTCEVGAIDVDIRESTSTYGHLTHVAPPVLGREDRFAPRPYGLDSLSFAAVACAASGE